MNERGHTILLAALIVAVTSFAGRHLSSPALANQTSTPAGEQQATRIRATTRLVQVNVIAEDKNGNPVTDLAREDFALTDKGQAQEIRIFSMESTREIPNSGPPLPPNTYTNRRPSQGSLPGSISVILIDTLNTKVQDQTFAREQIVKFLSQLRPEDRVALYVLRNNVHILHDYTSNAASLLRALARYQPNASRELMAPTDPAELTTGVRELDAFMSTMYAHEQDYFTMSRVQKTVVALEAIADHLAPIPGRKNLIWLSDSFPIAIGYRENSMNLSKPSGGRGSDTAPQMAIAKNSSRVDVRFDPDIERAAQALNNANLAVYPVQATGLTVNMRPIESGIAPTTINGRPGSMAQPIIARANTDTGQDAMNSMAERTGGRAYYNMNDLGNAIRRAIDDSRVTYLLGYYPAHREWNGEFREIKVSSKRPGVHLRFRRGYYAVPEQPLDDTQRRTLLQQYSWSPLEASAMGLTVGIERNRSAGADTVKLIIQADAREVEFDQDGTNWLGTLDLYFLEKAADGKPLNDDFRTLNMKINEERRQIILRQGLVIVRNLEVAAGAAQIRVLVRDNRTGKIGSVTVPLTGEETKPPS
jgi:VWFA-related protein